MLPYQDVHGVVDGAAMALAFLTADALDILRRSPESFPAEHAEAEARHPARKRSTARPAATTCLLRAALGADLIPGVRVFGCSEGEQIMSNDLIKRQTTVIEQSRSEDAASRLKGELMADMVDRILGVDEPAVPGQRQGAPCHPRARQSRT